MQQPRSTPPLRIAVINDDTAFLELMRDLLEEDGGYDAVICREWDNAHGFVKDKRPALVILDIRIGGGGAWLDNPEPLDARPRNAPDSSDRLLSRH